MPTVPTSIIKRLMGTEAFTDALNFGGVAQTLAAGTTVGGYHVDATNRLVTIAPATTTLTFDPVVHGNHVISIGSTAGLAISLPAPTGTGILYTIQINATISGGNLTIDAKPNDASAFYAGILMTNKVGTGATNYLTAANTNLLTFNGGTTGGIVGDIIEIQDCALHVWGLFGIGQQSGTIATPLSNH